MNEIQKTKATYDLFAKEYEEKTKQYVEKYLQFDFDLFLKSIKGKRILDIGSGPGRDSSLFKQKGFFPVCIDNSPAMISLCKKKGLEAYEMDMEHLTFEPASFDGIWAYTSLLHIPKSRVKQTLENIAHILTNDGIFYMGMKEGVFDGMKEDARYSGYGRYFAQYTKEELELLLSELFEIIHFSRVEINPEQIYLNFMCKKKKMVDMSECHSCVPRTVKIDLLL
ncbi:hypothetical protein COV18_03105 [Candidatus Woesearchaeota archaeon CG10_big_fil_rev_8_21_14_0_10_37_12]|nr:MAG: hypothetical protein COV18_03105 [Candidatus Woesearchaeota archaeon CG10_big_fil_rev_8_21_14_0_10_37_12]